MSAARWLGVLLALALAACAGPMRPPPAPLTLSVDTVEPEAASGWTPRRALAGQRHMVAAANPLASEAGLLMLRAGGSAVDAAVAVQAVLSLVEPQSSGIGGGGLMLTWDGRRAQAWDGRETAPASAHPGLFLNAQGQPLPLMEATEGGRAVATPGVLRMLELVHGQHGRLPWSRLFEPAIALAEDGFPLGPRLHELLRVDPLLRRNARARAFYYQADGQPLPVGTRLRNPALAAVLKAVAAEGAQALYTGPMAQHMVDAVQGDAVPGGLSLADLAGYRAVEREVLCTDWTAQRRVCGFPPPSSGHLTLMQILGLLQAHAKQHPQQGGAALLGGAGGAGAWAQADALHVYIEASRLAYADRAQYMADPDRVAPPPGGWTSLLDPGYLEQRARLIGPRAAVQVEAGRPPVPVGLAATPSPWAAMPHQEERGTSHVSVVDAQGLTVAFTTTIEAAFGSRVLVDGGSGLPGGFFLNNQMTDFSLAPTDAQGRPVANRVEGGKRPRSSMSPTLVFDRDSGALVASLGSPGGSLIIHFVAKMLLATQQWGLDVQEAINLPHAVPLGGLVYMEQGRWPPELLQALRERGHRLQERDLTSGIQAVERRPSGWLGGADPRREGVVRAD